VKNMLCVISQPPYASSHSLEAIEAAMVGAVFDFNVSVLFRGEGVWCLLDNQNAVPLQQRTVSKVLQALPTYDIDKIYVCSAALKEHNLAASDLCLPAKSLAPIEQGRLLSEQDVAIGAQS